MENFDDPADLRPPLLVVDGANVVGSVPDGWWRDRRGAAERLRDSLAAVARDGLPELPGPLTVVLVVEGAARGVESVPGVRVESAPGSGDDRIVELVAEESSRRCVVVTADRGLRERVTALGATPLGPRTVRRPGG
ncbi:NYN domain-containing protein [Kitasatospora griseola]|uniref:NTP pyrophosphohydrolase n=1 Tax=Kitasatospora griseola TaxID=2064 RepID=UPI00380DAF71